MTGKIDEPDEPKIPFGYEERESIAVSFAKAYLSSLVKVTFPKKEEFVSNPDDLEYLATVCGVSVEWVKENLTRGAARYRETFDENAAIIMRVEETTEDERKKSIDWVIRAIWGLQGARRIEGDFLAIPNIENRIKDLEKKAASHSRLLEELQIIINLSGLGRQQPP